MITVGDRHLADVEVTRIERDAALEWRLDGAEPGKLHDVTERKMRDALVEALAEVGPLREAVAQARDSLRETLDAFDTDSTLSSVLADADTLGPDGDDVRNCIDLVKASMAENVASRMLDLIEAMGKMYRGRVAVVPASEEIRVVAPKTAPVQARPRRLKLGSTTLVLPGFEVRIDEPDITSIAPVVPEKKQRASRKKAA